MYITLDVCSALHCFYINVCGQGQSEAQAGPCHLQPLATLWPGPLTRDRRSQVKHITATSTLNQHQLNKNRIGWEDWLELISVIGSNNRAMGLLATP